MVTINPPRTNQQDSRLFEALSARRSSTRLEAALAAGTRPETVEPAVLVARCAVETDFYVRDMLTWAITRHPADITVPLLLAELRTAGSQARSQALHTLSKIGDARAWPEITADLLRDPDDEVARSAWRAAVVLVPEAEEKDLAETLVSQLGRGDREMQRSLSRALVEIGEAAEAALRTARTTGDPAAYAHAEATERLISDPDSTFELDVEKAKRIVALGELRRSELDADR